MLTRWRKILIRTALFLALLFIFGGLISYTPWVQTRLAVIATNQLEEKLGVPVKIDRVHFRFFNSADIKGIYIEDYHGDTLLYTKRIQAQIRHLFFRSSNFSLKKLQIDDPVIKLIRYENEAFFDYELMVDRFDADTSDVENVDIKLALDQFELVNADLLFYDAHDSSGIGRIHFRDFQLGWSEMFFDGKLIQLTMDHGSGYDPRGFTLKSLEGALAHAPGAFAFDAFRIETNQNELALDGRIEYDSLPEVDWIHHLVFDVNVQKVLFNPIEFRPYLPALFPSALSGGQFSGVVQGTFNDFEARDLNLSWSNGTYFKGDLELVGLPETHLLYIDVQIDRMETSVSDLKRISRFIPDFEISEEISNLEYFRGKGTFKGRLNDFTTNFELGTALGRAKAKLTAQYPADRPLEMSYKGNLALINWNLGATLNEPEFGSTSLNIQIDGSGLSKELFDTDVTGSVEFVVYRGYTYQNAQISGHLSEGLFEGVFDVRDPKLDITFDGSVDLQKERPSLYFDLDVRTADLFRLGLIEDSIAFLSTNIDARFSGLGLDDAEGSLQVFQTLYETQQSVYYISDVDITSSREAQNRKISVESDLLEGVVEGVFTIADLVGSLKAHFRQYYEGIEPEDISSAQNLTYDFTLYNTLPITELLLPDVAIETGTRFYGSFSSDQNELSIQLDAPGIDYGKTRIQKLNIDVLGNGETFESTLFTYYIALEDGTQIDTLRIDNHTRRDSSLFDMYWVYQDSSTFSGSMHSYFTLLDSTSWSAGILSSHVSYLNDSIFIPSQNKVMGRGREIEIKRLKFEHEKETVTVNGFLSEDSGKSLDIALNGLRVEYLHPFIKDENTILHGGIKGDVKLFDVYNEFNVVGNVAIDDLYLNENLVGDFSAGIQWDDEMQAFAINAGVQRGKLKTLAVSGAYFPGLEHDLVQLRMNLDNFRLDVATEYTTNYMTELRGALDAEIELKVEGRDMSLLGWAELNKVGFTVPQTKVDYNVDGIPRVDFKEKSIEFKDFNFRDNTYETSGSAFGAITHRGLRNWGFDLYIDVDSTLVLNTEEGQYYYGTAFGTGRMSITGPIDRMKIAIKAAAEKGTEFALELGGASSVSEHSFISFVEKSSTSFGLSDKGVRKSRNSGYEMIFDVEIKNGVEAELIFDETVGDILKGTGVGQINLRMAEDGSMTMTGDYTVYSGSYLFTLQNLLSKRFDIQRGGTLKWTGDPYNAEIDLVATYPLRASLKPLGVSDSSRRRRPIEVDMSLTNQLMKPNIDFGVRVPNANSALQEEVELVVTRDDNELNRQVVSLLVMGSFITPEGTNNNPNGNLVNQGLTANTTEMLSNQLSRWISGINENFDVGVNYETGNDLNSEQVEVALSTQLFNDRVLVNSNIGVPLESTSTSNIVGDVEVEFKVSEDGRFRVKAFNRSDQNDPLSQQYQYIQGLGLVYTADFENFEEFWRVVTGQNKRDAARKRKEETAP